MFVILQSTRNKIIIYGGNGFVGTHLAEKLSSNKELCVVCLSRSGHKPKFDGVKAMQIRLMKIYYQRLKL